MLVAVCVTLPIAALGDPGDRRGSHADAYETPGRLGERARRLPVRRMAGAALPVRAGSSAAASRRARLARTAGARLVISLRARVRRALHGAPPSRAICAVFGGYCSQALAVARCESRLSTGAQNGQYLGLFQMGSSERRLYGHGDSAYQQARAAHRYFVASGRDWSPWSCKPWW